MASFVVQNACFSLNTRFWQCLILIQQASALPQIYTRVSVLVGSHCFTQDSARLTERRRKICDVEQAMLATLMDSSEALAPKKKVRIVKTRQILETEKIHAIVRFQPKVAAILNRGHPYM